MSDLSKLTEEQSNRILDIVAELQPVTAARVQQELATRHGIQADLEQVIKYMEWLRSGFPRKLAHAGPDLWTVVDLG
jgi:transposase